MHSLEEKNDTPLADAEISRLIKVSREIGYKKQDQIPERNLVDFKPLTIDKIAAQVSINQQEKEGTDVTDKHKKNLSAEVAVKTNEEKEQSPQVEEAKSADMKLNEPVEETKSTDMTLDRPVEEAPDDIINTGDITENSNNKELINEKNEEPETLNDEQASSPKENKNEEVVRQEGIEIGRKMALSEIQVEQKEVIDTLKKLVDNIKAKDTLDKSDLFQSILQVITHLASERAGTIIDENPEVFRHKISKFVDEIEHASQKVIIKLNPKDAKLIKNISADPFHNEGMDLSENSELLRGDFIIQVGSIEIANIISKQISVGSENTEKDDESSISSKEFAETNTPKTPEENTGLSAENEENKTGSTNHEK